MRNLIAHLSRSSPSSGTDGLDTAAPGLRALTSGEVCCLCMRYAMSSTDLAYAVRQGLINSAKPLMVHPHFVQSRRLVV
eukprot:1767929-Rhodomonas_salina.2